VIVAIATGGVALGTAALIITLAILSGFEQTLTDNLVGFSSHAEIAGYGNRPLPDYIGTSKALLRRVPSIKRLTPYVEQEVILRSQRGVVGLVLKGMPLSDTSLIARKRIVAGHDFSVKATDSIPELLLSKQTADALHTGVGKSIAAIRFNENLRTREDIASNFTKFRVVGLYQTGMGEYDNSLAYTTLDAAQRFSSYSPTQVNGYEVMTASLDSAKPVTARLNKLIHYPYFAQSVYDIHRPIFAWIELQKQPIPIILGLIIIVATFNVISTLLLIVIEKTHSIGVLKALGARDGGIARIFLTEGTAIAILGVLIGDAFGFTICALEAHFHFFKLRSEIYFMSSVPISIEWQHYVIVSTIAFVLALSATLIPARIASRMRPLSALKFG
jgi:lipoprotein-releasing system permease protein